MKILKITSWYPSKVSPLLGVFVQDQAKALAKLGMDVGVLYVDMDLRNTIKKINHHRNGILFEEECGVNVFRSHGLFPPKIYKSIFLKWISFFDSLFEEYEKRFGLPDILHAHNYQAGYAAMFLSSKYNIPYVITEHSSIFLTRGIEGWRKEIFEESFRKTSKIISVSQGLKNSLSKYYSKEITVIPNLIDTELFSIKHEKTNDKIQLISVGDLIPIKGFDFLIKAFSHIKSPIKKKLQLTIIGNGSEKKKLKNLILSLGEQKNIFLLGEVSRTDVAAKMRDSDMYILSSLKETFGVVVIEAMAVGLPILSTKCVGPENIIPEFAGFFITPGNESALTEGIEKMYTIYHKKSPDKIRNYVLENFDEKVIAKRLVETYQSCI